MNDDLVDVQLIGLPVAVHHQASMHMKALQREFDLIRQGDPEGSSIPHRLLALIGELSDEFGGVGEQPVEHLDDAVERGDETVDLSYRIPPSAGPASERLGELLDEADAYCAGGAHLLTLVTPLEALRYRKWFLSQFIRQTAGLPPVPWPDYHGDDTQLFGVSGTPDDGDSPVNLPAGWAIGHRDDTASLTVSGPVDIVTAPALRDALAALIPAQLHVAVDLTGCDFLDSIGVSVLMAAHLRASQQNVELSFRLSDPARRVVTISGLADRLHIEN
ncbi:MAG: STAS domain-containing protein [Actinobacteria bacterium]|nr:STAS domain-containing protein [Actinomycetota bacterium]